MNHRADLLLLHRPGTEGGNLRLCLEAEPAGLVGLRLMWQPAGQDWQDLHYFGGLPDRSAAETLAQKLAMQKQTDGFLMAGQTVPAVEPTALSLGEARQARLLSRLQADDWRLLAPGKRTRLVWQIGELRLKPAVPRLVTLLESGDDRLDYCLAWAIGRCGDTGARDAMHHLAQRGRSEATRRLARWAELALSDSAERDAWAERLIADWPATLREAWATPSMTHIDAVLSELASQKSFKVADWLEQLDEVAQCQPTARPVLLAQLADMPLAAGNFRALRHLYKAAEFRGDADIWALLQHRFEQTGHNFYYAYPNQSVYLGRKWVKVCDELPRSDSRLAYSNRTRNYLLRRGWRSLRRLGAYGSPEFAPLAYAALRSFDDASAPAHQVTVSTWDRGYRTHIEYRHAHARSPLFNRLLFRPDGPIHFRRNGAPAYALSLLPAQRPERYEPYAKLWDTRPDLLLQLALASHAEWVQAFAVRALADLPAYCARMQDVHWRSLLGSPFAVTATFASQHITRLLAAETSPLQREPWLVLLLGSRHAEVVQAGLALFEQDPAAYAHSTPLVVGVLTARHAEVRRHARLICQVAAADSAVAGQIVTQLLEWLTLADTLTESLEAIVENIGWAVAQPLRQAAALADYPALLALTDHTLLAVRCLAVDWLILHQQPVQTLPPTLFRQLLESDEPRLLAAGLRLLAAMPLPLLLAQAELVGMFCVSPHTVVREQALLTVEKLLTHDPAFANALLPKLLSVLYRTEQAPGMHDAIHGFLTQTLASACQNLPVTHILSLLQARSTAAQRFGAWLLPQWPDESLSVADWVSLARCDTQDVRQRAMAVLDRLFAGLAPATLLPILDGRWDDSRQQLLSWLAQRVPNRQWQTTELITLADHANPSVQAFGCAQLATRLAEGQDADCLLALAEHPSLAVQGFVAHWLQTVLSQHPERLPQFAAYFRLVLSQVNKGRQIKRTLHALLRQQAMHSEALAREVASLFEWLAVTVAIGDKAQYVAGLYEIRRRFPGIETRLTIAAPAVRGEG
ncbi:HEAT repeat domain-containing protein [Parachitinimonas caeni]|uniref:HEAT repeat domain-containing protein n=1 Tax=Parachitinimonas caeni TaxID=3031301 RepID=A0ABT7DYF9_9NEIS|nr:HEAT repeat domain-containing protein [Parachitinimonas caeni]MDK2125090.1 HEAT repeat domain-containing protein [Parachitinimonas caeni]